MNKLVERFEMRFETEMKQKLEMIAEEQGISLAKFIRKQLEKEVKKFEKKNKKK